MLSLAKRDADRQLSCRGAMPIFTRAGDCEHFMREAGLCHRFAQAGDGHKKFQHC